jgi:hypothetical protein
MSVFNASGPDGCWLCGEEFPPGSVVVFWHGSGGDLALHPTCAEALGGALIFEGRRAGMVQRGQNPLAGVVCRPSHDDHKVVELRRKGDGR